MLAKTSIYPITIILPSAILVLDKITFKKSLLIALLLSVPAAVIGSEMQIGRGSILTLLPFLGLFITHLLINYSNYINKLKHYASNISIELILTILSLSIFTLGYALKEITIITLSLALIVLTLKNNRQIGILILALQISVIAFLYNTRDFHKYAIILSIAYIVHVISIQNRKKTNYLLLALAILPLLSYFAIDKSFKSTAIFLEIIPFFILINRKAIWGLALILVSFTISTLIFQNSVYQYLLIGYAIIRVIKELAYFKETNLEKPIIKLSITMIAIVVAFSGHVHSPISQKLIQQYQRFQTEYLNNQPSKNTNTGRKINYIENTLSGQYTREEILATGFATIAEYVRLTIFPTELSFYYGYAKVKTVNFNDKTVWLGLLLYISLIAYALSQFRKTILISIGIAWYLLNITLFSNWFEPIAGMVGERLAYTASAGFCLAVSAFILKLKPSFSLFKPKRFELLIFLVLILFSMRSISRNSDWKDTLTLMERDIKHLDNSAQAHNLLALNLMYASTNNKKISEQKAIEMQNKAAYHLQKSIDIYPNFFNTNFDLAKIYLGIGEFTKAKKALEQSLKIDPENLFALEEMAKTCYELKLVNETEKYANIYLAKVPKNENMHEILIYNMLVNNMYQSAIYYAERAMSYYPNNQIIQRMYADAKRLSATTSNINQ
jgi:tetratricopeptide (TPR) repeat protein